MHGYWRAVSVDLNLRLKLIIVSQMLLRSLFQISFTACDLGSAIAVQSVSILNKVMVRKVLLESLNHFEVSLNSCLKLCITSLVRNDCWRNSFSFRLCSYRDLIPCLWTYLRDVQLISFLWARSLVQLPCTRANLVLQGLSLLWLWLAHLLIYV